MPTLRVRVLRMTPRLLALGACLLALTSCVSSRLENPAIIGASASAGFGASVGPTAESAVHTDLETTLLACISTDKWLGGCDPIMLADPSFSINPEKVGDRQLQQAVASEPSIVFAIDWLFWHVFGPQNLAPDMDDAKSLQNLDIALSKLDTLREKTRAPLVVGDLPLLDGTRVKAINKAWIPPRDRVERLNQHIRAWASSRPGVSVYALSAVTDEQRFKTDDAEASVDEGSRPFASRALVQSDGLHPTAAGLCAMMFRTLDTLANDGVIERDDLVSDPSVALARLEPIARNLASRQRPGWFQLLQVGLLRDRLMASLKVQAQRSADNQPADCSESTRLAEELFEQTTSFRGLPDELLADADYYLSNTIDAMLATCPDLRRLLDQARLRLNDAVLASAPDPWALHLWATLNHESNDDARTLDRLLELAGPARALPEPYRHTRASVYFNVIRSNARVLELYPDLKPKVDRLTRDLKDTSPDEQGARRQISEQARASAEEAERDAKEATDPTLREQLLAKARELRDPERIQRMIFEYSLTRLAELELACERVGRTIDAQMVRSRTIAIVGVDKLNSARQEVLDEINQSASTPQEQPPAVQPTSQSTTQPTSQPSSQESQRSPTSIGAGSGTNGMSPETTTP